MLRRCLGQQGEVRLSLYMGLAELVETSPSLNPIIFEILQAHVSVRRAESDCSFSIQESAFHLTVGCSEVRSLL